VEEREKKRWVPCPFTVHVEARRYMFRRTSAACPSLSCRSCPSPRWQGRVLNPLSWRAPETGEGSAATARCETAANLLGGLGEYGNKFHRCRRKTWDSGPCSQAYPLAGIIVSGYVIVVGFPPPLHRPVIKGDPKLRTVTSPNLHLTSIAFIHPLPVMVSSYNTIRGKTGQVCRWLHNPGFSR